MIIFLRILIIATHRENILLSHSHESISFSHWFTHACEIKICSFYVWSFYVWPFEKEFSLITIAGTMLLTKLWETAAQPVGGPSAAGITSPDMGPQCPSTRVDPDRARIFTSMPLYRSIFYWPKKIFINADLEILVHPFVPVGFSEAMIWCLLNSVAMYTCF